MTITPTETRPRLRLLDFQPVHYQGQQMWLLRDPWQLRREQLIFPAALAPLLVFCDGTRTPHEIQRDFSLQVGTAVPYHIVADALTRLDEAGLLDNERSAAMVYAQLVAYRSQPFRRPALADLSYPGRPQPLTELLNSYGEEDSPTESTVWNGRGVVSPHIDYQRGGPVYAQVWRRAAPAVLQADLVVILGTDHNGGPGSVTLTRQPYATPYGVLPIDGELVERLAEALGPEAAFAQELNHLGEHSVELSAVWLHYTFHQAGLSPCPMVPILAGSLHHYLNDGLHPADDPGLNRLIDILRREAARRRVLFVGSVDLAHVGPHFGDDFAMDARRRTALRLEDEELIESILKGDAAGFYRLIAAVRDRNRICGFSPLYLMLRCLGPTTGAAVAYAHCPADAENNSLVSICGLLLD